MATMYRVQVVVSPVGGSPEYLTGHFLASEGTPQQAATAWFNFVNRTAPGIISGTVYNFPSTVELVDSTTGQVIGVVGVTGTSVTGTNTAQRLPGYVQMGITWRSGIFVGGRQVMGRTNLPGWTEGDNSALGRPEATAVAAAVTRAGVLLDDANSSFGIYSPKNGQFYPASSALVAPEWFILKVRR